MFQTNQGPSFPAHQFILSGTSTPDTNSPLFASENMNVKGAAGCIGPANQAVSLIDPLGSETSNPPIYPCFEHPTLTDLLNSAGVSWKYYTPTAGSIWSAPDAINHMCMPKKQGNKLVCTGADYRDLAPDSFANAGMVLCKLQMMRSQPFEQFRAGTMLAAGLTLRHYRAFADCPSLARLIERLDRELPDYKRFGIHVLVSQNGRGELAIGDSHEYGDRIDLEYRSLCQCTDRGGPFWQCGDWYAPGTGHYHSCRRAFQDFQDRGISQTPVRGDIHEPPESSQFCDSGEIHSHTEHLRDSNVCANG